VHLDTIKVFFYLPTDIQDNFFESNIKIYIKTDPTSALFELAKVTKTVYFN